MKFNLKALDFVSRYGTVGKFLLVVRQYNDIGEAIRVMEEDYIGEFSDIAQFGRYMAPVILDPEIAAMKTYIDFDSYGDDLIATKHFFQFRTPEGHYHIFLDAEHLRSD